MSDPKSIVARQEAALWRYRARALRAIDGDTIIMVIEAGFDWTYTTPVRLLGLNTPELIGKDPTKARHALEFVQSWLIGDPLLYVQTKVVREHDKYGRVLATVFREGDPLSLNAALLNEGLAVPM